MGRSGSHKARGGTPGDPTGRGAERRGSTAKRAAAPPAKGVTAATGSHGRVAQLEAELAATRQALHSQKVDYQEDSASFEKTLARLAQSERALSQTKAKLVHAEAHANAADARADELQNKLSDLHVELAELSLRHVEATAQVTQLGQERDAALARSANLQRVADESRAELTSAEERIKVLTQERTRLLELMASLEVLGREMSQLTNQATAEAAPLPKVEAWLGRDVEAEHVRATVRPEGMSAPPPKAPRVWSAPEIVVDGVKLES